MTSDAADCPRATPAFYLTTHGELAAVVLVCFLNTQLWRPTRLSLRCAGLMSQVPPRKPAPGRRKPMSGRKSFSALSGHDTRPPPARRASVTVAGLSGAPKVQRTSKTSQKLVLLPSAVQTKPLPGGSDDEDLELGYETDAGLKVKDYKSAGERLSKDERRRRGFKRITAYCVAEGVKMKLLAGFLRREHNVVPRIFDEAMYVVRVPYLAAPHRRRV